MLSRIQATSKLYFLAIIMSVFIIGIGMYGISQIKVMDRNTQTMYNDRVSALQQLTAVRFSYTAGILSLVQETKDHLLTFSEAKNKIERAQERITSNWKAYMLTYATPEEDSLAKQTSALLDRSLITIQRLNGILIKEDTVALNNTSYKELYESVNPVVVKLSELINLQIKIGEEVYNNSNEIYNAAIKKFLIIICLSLLFAIPFSYYLIREVKLLIQRLQISLGKITESEEKYRNIFENVQDVFFQTSLSGIILDVSPSIKNLLGIAREELVGTQVIDIYYDPENREKMLNTLEEKGELRDFELQFRTISGEPVHVSINAHLIPDINGNKSHIDGTLINITERKLMESERQRIINDLLQRNRDLEQFAYIVSHNLRAPVANIIGITDYIEDTEIHMNEKQEMIKGLSISVNKLDIVIKDLNDILQMKREVSEKKEIVKFSGLLNDIKLSIANLIEKEKVSFISDFEAIDEMKTIRSYLYSIFYNLISNSIKYKKPNIAPGIEIRTVLSGNIIMITFKDNGLGIDLKKRKEQIFGLYKRFHTHSDGKGMGLYMVKNQVEVLGGKISIQSEVNKGTEFKIEFENSL